MCVISNTILTPKLFLFSTNTGREPSRASVKHFLKIKTLLVYLCFDLQLYLSPLPVSILTVGEYRFTLSVHPLSVRLSLSHGQASSPSLDPSFFYIIYFLHIFINFLFFLHTCIMEE